MQFFKGIIFDFMYGTSEIKFFNKIKIWQIKMECAKKTTHIENNHLAYNQWNVYFTDIVKIGTCSSDFYLFCVFAQRVKF